MQRDADAMVLRGTRPPEGEMASSSTTADAGAPFPTVGARQYAFLVFLTLLNVMNFVDRQLLPSFANFIVPELGLTNAQFGWLTGFAFIVFYSVAGLFAGALADLVHRPRLVSVAVTLWSALTAASGAARGFVTLLVPRMFIGVGESVLTPASMSMLADRFPAARMGFASGFYYMGVPIGVGASLLVGGYLEPIVGWRGCFYLLGILGVVLAGLMLFVKESPRQHVAVAPSPVEQVERQGFREIAATLWEALRASPALTATMAGGVAFHFILGAAAFDQLWFVQERGFDRTEILRLTGWIGMISGMAGNLFGGIGGDAFQRRTGQGRPMFLVWVGVAFTPLGFVYRLADPESIWFWVGVSAGFFQLGTFYGPTFSTIQELVPPRIRATVVALYILLLNFIGLGIGITGGGYMIDALMAAGVAEPYTKTLLVFTVLSSTAIPCFWVAGRRFGRDRDRLYRVVADDAADGGGAPA
jgi:MFS family permease